MEDKTGFKRIEMDVSHQVDQLRVIFHMDMLETVRE
jgi:hypothetical protein